MANLSLGFNLSANAAGMAQGINAGVVELEKLGLAAKQTAGDVRVLTGLQLGTAFVSAVRAVATSFTQFTAGAAQSIDSTNKLSRALGVSFGELQRLQLEHGVDPRAVNPHRPRPPRAPRCSAQVRDPIHLAVC